MKRIEIRDDVRPLTDVRKHLAEIVARVQRTNRPLVLTQRGRAVAVMLSPAEYDEMAGRDEFVKAVHVGLAEADAGKLVPHDEVVAWLKRKRAVHLKAMGKASKGDETSFEQAIARADQRMRDKGDQRKVAVRTKVSA